MAARPLPCHPAFLGCPGLAGLPAVPSWGGRPQGQRRLCRRDRGPPRGVPAGRTAAGRARARLCRWGSSLRPGPQRFCGVARRAALVRAAPWCFRKGGRLCLEGPAAPGSVVPRPSTQAGWGGQGSSVLRGRSCGSVLCAAPPWPLGRPAARQPVVCPLLFSSVLSASGCRGASWEFGGASQSF